MLPKGSQLIGGTARIPTQPQQSLASPSAGTPGPMPDEERKEREFMGGRRAGT